MKGINNDKKVFDKGKYWFNFNDKVSRITGETLVSHFEIELDVNTDIYPMKVSENYDICIANSLTADGNEEFDLFRQGQGP